MKNIPNNPPLTERSMDAVFTDLRNSTLIVAPPLQRVAYVLTEAFHRHLINANPTVKPEEVVIRFGMNIVVIPSMPDCEWIMVKDLESWYSEGTDL